eukprot:TRINITY_DN13286_c0_g1_i5.p1 TRINITY_DN13286_c0_g1~~TRINITY_DN13286_c0_g1_i5.p1  ORF type:complete len:545 (+),score=184.67 TRINITY_DN13286_c0_g1_i5:158-1792(+)
MCIRDRDYLRLSTLSAMHTLLEAERRAAQIHVGRAEVDKGVKAWVHNLQQTHAQSNFNPSVDQTPPEASPAAVSSEDRKSVLKAFASQFQELVHNSPAALQAVVSMEKSYGDALAELTDEREAAMAHMQNRQSGEMEHVCMQTSVSNNMGQMEEAGAQDPVARTVMRHLKETIKKEKEWDRKFEGVIQWQREEYRQEIDQLHTQLDMPSTPRTKHDPEVATASFMYKQHRLSVGSPSAPAPDSTAVQPEQRSSSFFDLFYRGNSSVASDSEANVVAATQEPLACKHEGFTLFQCSYGKLRGPEYRVSVANTPIQQLFDGQAHSTDERSDARVHTLLSLYSDELAGLVAIIDTDMSDSSPSTKALVHKCQKSPELHFDTFNSQRTAVQAKIKQGGALEPGDFFITQHSCLEHIHIIFHLAAGRNDVVFNPEAPDLYDRSPVLIGLTGILMAANQCGIASLAIPIMLVDEGWHQAMSVPATALKRAEKVLQRVKTFFLDYKGDDGSLRSIFFLVPSSLSEAEAATLSFSEQCGDLVIKTFRQNVSE